MRFFSRFRLGNIDIHAVYSHQKLPYSPPWATIHGASFDMYQFPLDGRGIRIAHLPAFCLHNPISVHITRCVSETRCPVSVIARRFGCMFHFKPGTSDGIGRLLSVKHINDFFDAFLA